MKILIIGGTGTISSAITRQLSESDHELWLLNRGTRKAEVPANVHQVVANIDDTETVLDALGDETFDAVTVAYGARNFHDLDAGLREMCRVLIPGGHLMLVELTTPPRFPMKQLFHIYSHTVMPFIGRLISHNDSAYTYLPQSMSAFPQAEELKPRLLKAGFSDVQFQRFTFGLSTMYLATK